MYMIDSAGTLGPETDNDRAAELEALFKIERRTVDREAVRKAALALDDDNPGWARRITRVLNLSDPCECVLGQAYPPSGFYRFAARYVRPPTGYGLHVERLIAKYHLYVSVFDSNIWYRQYWLEEIAARGVG